MLKMVKGKRICRGFKRNMHETVRLPKVFTVGLRAKGPKDNHWGKIKALVESVGMADFDWKNKLVAVKTHFGEKGNPVFPRPTLLRPIIELIKARGGKPFLAETSTLYTGSRSNAPDHIETALMHGFGYEVTGAPIFICDGLTGREGRKVQIEGGELNEVSVASGIYEADALVVVSHFKGHEISGFGGAIKNLAMGCCSRTAKLKMHSSLKVSVIEKKCVRCLTCIDWCSAGAISQKKSDGQVVVNQDKCRGCGECLVSCRVGAIKINWDSDTAKVSKLMVEHALGVMKNKRGKAFFLNILMDIVPLCDCYGFADSPIVPDIGFAASVDPVALDALCIDLVNSQPGLRDSALKSAFNPGEPKFAHVHEKVDTEIQIKYGEKIGLGSSKYERVSLD